MKTIFTLFTSLLMSLAVFAAAKPKSILTIKSADNADIRIVLDGKRFESGDKEMMIRGIDEGYHNVKVFRERRNGFFNLSGSRFELVYNSAINVKRRTHLFITIERNGRVTMQENRIKKDGDRQDRDWDDNRNSTNYEFDRDEQWGDYDYKEVAARAMNDREFRSVLESIEKEWLESNKLKSALQVVKTNSLATAQVEQVLLLFSFENNKLEVAKQAYANTVDKRNYHNLYDVFSFKSSQVELERYISRNR